MKWWRRRRARWALRALDALWCGAELPRALGLGRGDLAKALKESPAVRGRYTDLVAVDVEAMAGPALSAADAALLGLDDISTGPAVRSFEERVLLATAPDTQPSGVRPRHLAWAGAAAAIAIALLVVVPRLATEADMAEPASEFAARSAAPAEAVQLPLALSGVCLTRGADGPVVVEANDEMSDAITCPEAASFQALVSDPHARALSVAVFAVQRSNSGEWSTVPHAPTPASTDPVRLEGSAAAQPVGRPHRLAVNHQAGGDGWLVVVARKDDITYADLERTMKVWEAGKVPAQSEADGWEAVTVRPFVVKGQR